MKLIHLEISTFYNGNVAAWIDFTFGQYFYILGCFFRCSGFEDIVFQSRVCTSGSLKGALSASQYNRAWRIHHAISEALEKVVI